MKKVLFREIALCTVLWAVCGIAAVSLVMRLGVGIDWPAAIVCCPIILVAYIIYIVKRVKRDWAI